MDTYCLGEANIGVILNKCSRNHDYKHHVGEIVKTKKGTIKILSLIKININRKSRKCKKECEKGYKYICLKDKNIDIISEASLSMGTGCPVCSNRKVRVGINDMWTTNPEQAKLLADPDDGYKYTQCSHKKVDWKCPECGNIIKNKCISEIFRRGLLCPVCSDSISYPEKFMYNFLQQLNIKFKYQYVPKWCKYIFENKLKQGRYDFYIPEKRLIIETDGGWHNNDNTLSGITTQESKEIDKTKDQLAKEHNIQMIRINCIKSDFGYIKNNILNSELSKLYDLANIDWNQIDTNIQKSLVKDVCDYRKNNPSKTTKQISDVYHLSRLTITKYLKIGNTHSWCKYDAKEECIASNKRNGKKRGKKVICINTKTVYQSSCQAAKEMSICRKSINNCCNGKCKSAGKLLDGTKLNWIYYDEYIEKLRKDDKN